MPGPLDGVRVLELGNFIAGPYCGTMLGYFGAEVIKVEPPGGDQIRQFRDVDSTGTSWWWRGLSRNKKSICLDMKKEGAQAMVRDLAAKSDVLIENFKPGKMEQWGVGPEDLSLVNSELIYSRISGYGQTGPYSPRPGFASACEAMGGIRYVNGFPDRPSVRPNLSIGDTLAGIHAALGVVMALYARQARRTPARARPSLQPRRTARLIVRARFAAGRARQGRLGGRVQGAGAGGRRGDLRGIA